LKNDPAEIFALLQRVFAETLPDRTLPTPEEPLLGDAAPLDSMELVAFVADVEAAVEEQYGRPVVLADERALSRNRSPFRSLAALAEYVGELLGPAAG
jgi:acyl carrier protein